jgi:hypothetical protein
VLGDQQLQEVERWLHALTARRPQHLFLVTATPVLYVHLVAFLKLIQVVGWESPLTENIQDAWLAPHNQAECRRLLRMLGFQAFLAENLLCVLEPLILPGFRH